MSFNAPPFKTKADISGLKVTIMGLGLNGGGLASARFFAQNGAIVTITDTKTETELEPSIAALKEFKEIRYVLGKHESIDFSSADTVIKNPGVKLEGNTYLSLARSIETDISVFLRFSRAPLIAVTGSKGKSSTVSALHFALIEMGYPAFLGGNITVSPLSFLDHTHDKTPVVLELSSWQLADLKGRGLLKPTIAIITPIMPDHLNWYGTMEKYVADKKLIYADMGAGSHLLCNKDDGWGAQFADEVVLREKIQHKTTGIPEIHWYSTKIFDADANKNEGKGKTGAWFSPDGIGYMSDSKIPTEEILPKQVTVPGKHMRGNLLTAALALNLFGCDREKTAKALARFPGIPHRLEFFFEKDGVSFYNDSTATIPEATAEAIQAFETSVILLCGGTDKNLDFTPLAQKAHLAKRILLLAGTGTDKFIPLLRENNIPFEGPYASLCELLTATKKIVAPKDRVVFSPGATSFGLFINEFDRGIRFKEETKKIFA